jgi:hypothetical protein
MAENPENPAFFTQSFGVEVEAGGSEIKAPRQ